MSVKCLLKLSLLLKRQSPRNYCFKNCLTMQLISFFTIMVRSLNHSVLYTCIILGDPGAVSWAGRKGATKVFKYGRKSPGYWLSPDHFQMVKRMLAPDWAQKMLCIIVPNRRTASPEFFSWVRTQRLLTRSRLIWLMHQRNARSQETFSLI